MIFFFIATGIEVLYLGIGGSMSDAMQTTIALSKNATSLNNQSRSCKMARTDFGERN